MHGYGLLEDADEATACLFERGFLEGDARTGVSDWPRRLP